MFLEKDISTEQVQKIRAMQKDIQHFLDTKFGSDDRIPFNIHRIGVYMENEEVALDLGYFNYKELVALHTYINMNNSVDYDGTTYIDHIASKGEDVRAGALSKDAYKTELSMMAWLGSNVGQGFLQKYMENLESK